MVITQWPHWPVAGKTPQVPQTFRGQTPGPQRGSQTSCHPWGPTRPSGWEALSPAGLAPKSSLGSPDFPKATKTSAGFPEMMGPPVHLGEKHCQDPGSEHPPNRASSSRQGLAQFTRYRGTLSGGLAGPTSPRAQGWMEVNLGCLPPGRRATHPTPRRVWWGREPHRAKTHPCQGANSLRQSSFRTISPT